MKKFSISLIVIAALAFLITGCGKNPQASTATNLTLSIRAVTGGLNKNASPLAPQVTITSAKVVIGKIEFETALRDSMDFKSRTPLVVTLDLTGKPTPVGAGSIPLGTYNEMEFEIRRLRANDGQVYLDNPGLQNRSIAVRGYVNGDTSATFVFTSALEEEQETEFSPPLVVEANSPQANVMLTLDTTMWFSNGAGGYLDPRAGQNQYAIEKNIKASIKAFEDEDGDGEDDDDDDDSNDDDGAQR